MRTIAWLKKELEKFPDDAMCFAYDDEVTGLVIEKIDDRSGNQGIIYCSEGSDLSYHTEFLNTD